MRKFIVTITRGEITLIEAYYDESENNQQEYYVMIGAQI
jgi:hypothetical protein